FTPLSTSPLALSTRTVPTELYARSLHDALPISVPNWWFSLLFSFKGQEYRVSRTGDGKKITLNEKPIKLKKYREWLDSIGFFTLDRKSTRLNSSHVKISYAVFCVKKKKNARKAK